MLLLNTHYLIKNKNSHKIETIINNFLQVFDKFANQDFLFKN